MLALHTYLNEVVNLDEIRKKMKELKVEVKEPDNVTRPVFLFNYEDDAPRGDPIVEGCRGTMWYQHSGEWICLRATFDRFYNLGEESAPKLSEESLTKEEIQFQEKLDGTLIILYWNGDKWVWGTRNTITLAGMLLTGGRDAQKVINSMNLGNLYEVVDKHRDKTFLFELCTPYNQVVVFHPDPKLVLLGVRSTEDGFEEFDPTKFPFDVIQLPKTFSFKTLNECQEYIEANGGEKFEGLVLKFGTVEDPIRLKFKSKAFVALAHNSKCTAPPEEQIVMAILKNDLPELLAYYPTWKDKATAIENVLKKFQEKIKEVDVQLARLPASATKKDQAEIVKKSPETSAYHFAKGKYKSELDYLMEVAKKNGAVGVLKVIGYEF